MSAVENQAPPADSTGPPLSVGRLAEAACLLEVTARKPGNVHQYADLPGLRFVDFLLSATAIAEPLDQAAEIGIGRAVLKAIEATRRVVSTNTNLGIVLLLAPLAAVPKTTELAAGIEDVLAATTIDDARYVYRAIRLAQPGGLGRVDEQDVTGEPTASLRAIMQTAAERDLIASQYSNGFRDVLGDALTTIREKLQANWPLETAIISCHLGLLAKHPDSLITRKYGITRAREVSRRASGLIRNGYPEREDTASELEAFDRWLRHPDNQLNPGTTADLVTAALYAALREGMISLPLARAFGLR
jgi:triphosphoribosyl-dephospho-CoA synthase